MEHRIGQNSPPVHAAGTDPAYVPGLTPPRPAEAEKQPPVVADAPVAGASRTEREPEPKLEPKPEPQPDAAAEAAAEEPRPVADGPAFEASDRRGSVTVDGTGVTFRLDDETAEFGWPEIGAVELDTPRFGRRLTVTVYTTDRRSYDADIEAPNRGLPKQWAAELDAVLDAYFEDASN
ncbi:hypothetical protein ACFOSC_15035 [Streptantibioticus rubrisoli]|uniref:Uncharacterized protein n=1 Tax=Streptantibioticus rubrisoli TaxID=1387313 RepID=A0ABT1P9J8_9ACTN|nr:hypothetical protein [Streptantibioticus rubrisoli]MCQ4042037.1 hypothetical protein [Streptantibioticus rubrisoli]